jgi:putrescine transport system permease protein
MVRLVNGIFNRLVIAVPFGWLLIFFLVPFFIVFRISLSSTAIAMPPYTPVFDIAAGWEGFADFLSQLSFDNFFYLTQDSLYVKAYISSVTIAFFATLMTLLVG